ncbi:cell division protein FtsA [Lederbergia galactosidilytica]|uniref:Cell division protein n=1 Tax=Lederbergia galactosidilytica TaxID=217031 RepID=A0A177ZJP6_9BACI|nr:cell division protein FtsA [Lederbergia galactosidilytica]KRG14572.1 cell division protein [Virgibacillus soli]MBP1915343.1 cell division protein FtsA [Lederbergia galactosidilytica]OAK68162.1 cell division protein [Lederbergia galactosidilytica]
MKKERIFALDIGTRSVVGLILEQTDDQYQVLDLFMKEHKARAMHDGQIHDIVAVAEVIIDVKNHLEEKHGSLTKVCVAAAGRSLKTEKAKAEVNITGKPMLTKEDILYLELSAVQNAQAIAAQEQNSDHMHSYYCVGYSVLHYFIDQDVIGNLIDQQGEQASVEIIATFLPRTVVDSLIKALNRANLKLDALTLEPIAAINVLVPVSMRRLNVALVDIGAGTSDIAITNEGTVVAYGMVPNAGDEITEAVSEQLLLDFPVAEKVKRQLWDQESVKVKDILGFETEVPKEEVVAQIIPVVKKLATEISNEVKLLNNGHSPKAVMLVGGGSMTPELPKQIAGLLGLPENRVAIRGADAIQGLTFSEHISNGPENITPIGIAISARNMPIKYVSFTLNEQPSHMFAVKELTVSDCLLASGLTIKKLYGKPGLASFISLNGQALTIPGTYGKEPTIMKNGEECELNDIVHDGDQLTVEKGADGTQTAVKIKDLLDEVPQKTAIINGEKYPIQMTVMRNGKETDINTTIQDGDIIKTKYPETINELIQMLQLNELYSLLHPFRIKLNGKEMFFPYFSGQILLNGHEVKSNEKLPNYIELTVVQKMSPTIKNLALLLQHPIQRIITVFYEGQPVTVQKASVDYFKNGAHLDADTVLNDGDEIEYKETPHDGFIFQDIFKYVEVHKPQGAKGNFSLIINGNEATFYSPIRDGDQLEIVWPVAAD